ncbi:MAG: phage tail protein, partial [Acinetobacter junii]|nr:phage tail protein [Acinetobacter junii]
MPILQDTIAPLGHTIIALSTPPDSPVALADWIDHLNSVSGAINQKPAILVIPFSNIEDAEDFAALAPVKTSYRVLCVCYHGANGQEAELAGAMAAALADSADPAVPFNGVNLSGITPVEDKYRLTFERIELALNRGVCMIDTGADDKPEIVRA